MRYPRPLQPGCTIGVTAPSSGVSPPCQPRLDLVLNHLRQRGFAVIEGGCLRESPGAALPSPEQRAAELMDFFLREDVDAVLPPRIAAAVNGTMGLMRSDLLRLDIDAFSKPKRHKSLPTMDPARAADVSEQNLPSDTSNIYGLIISR